MDRARFMGRMAASLSHDLCNVLAVIQQASGLMGDYLALARKNQRLSLGVLPKFKYDAKFQEIISQVQTQVDRGQDLCESLSRLAHSSDDAQSPTDLAFAAWLMARLSGRMAKKNKVAITVEPGDGRALADVAMVDALAALEAALLAAAWRCREQGELRLRGGLEGDEAYVDILNPALNAGEAGSLAGELAACRGPFQARAVEGGVRLGFPRAGREG
ncbi:hypothetical protein NNJEOMEG_01569 [Fundidesulfovibrio magnetotacticus]|uniref:Signal transduction histidine kinase dimerisation/phosphoacceptor domain-containing protein n=1 Tax=Fundidesulfovibrio magnetotacticus TaxID=2730080 RepID=A0A6V8LZS7_9BACT|nr:hypothetical protein [Fundidesulfovibrio magnetotacticus]GFK93735.1 hypothetical protein NNJEOMEG_01569 [Fundidesulfovibrio magnetotacticus]